jgi:hypothetical protein
MEVRGIRRSLAGLVVVALAGCGGQGPGSTAGASPSTQASLPAAPSQAAAASPDVSVSAPTATSTAAPSPSPTAAPELQVPNAVNFAQRTAMRVIVSGLNVRAWPSTSGAKIAKAPKGSVWLFFDAPVRANGFQWYFGEQASNVDGGIPALPTAFETGLNPLTGWIASGTSDAPYLAPLDLRCPATISLANVEGMLASERVGCFGSDTIELKGTYGCGGCGGVAPGDFTPRWLAGPLDYSFLSAHPAEHLGLNAHFAPDGPAAPPEGTIIRARGHFADERSSSCLIAPFGADDTPEPIPGAIARAYCRAQFVVTSFEVLGTDPTFPG